jgi:DNA-binding LacI/PurR family transcriptional regulator
MADLQALIAAPEAYLAGGVAVRGLRDIGTAKEQCTNAVATALTGIRDGVVATGGHAVEGLLLMDAALLREALVVVGTELADRIGLDLRGLSKRVVEFVIAANEKIIAMLGINALDEARKQLETWLEQLKAGTLFPQLADTVLQTQTVQTEVDGWITGFGGLEAALLMASDEITQLQGRFAAKLSVADKLLSALAVAKLAPPLMTPVGRLAMAAAYLGLLAYTVGSGYDHTDSDKVKLLDWTEGVRGVAKRLLVAAPA